MFFDFYVEGEAAEAVFCYDAVAGDDYGVFVATAGGADGAGGFWVADFLGYFLICCGFAVGDFEDGFPDFLLEVGAGLGWEFFGEGAAVPC